MARKVRSKVGETVKHLFIIGILIFAFIPFYLMLNISLKDNEQFFQNPWLPSLPFHWENYVYGWNYIGMKIFNTTFVAVTSTVLSIAMSVVGAYFFARFKMPGSKVLFFVFTLLMMYPGVANMVPMFKLISSLGMYNTYWALILPAIAGGQAFNIYVLRNFIEDIPQDLFDAIEIDGGNVLQQIWHIVVPMSMPIIGTLGILKIIGQWNNFIGPLLYIRDDSMQMLSVSLLYLDGEYTKQWGQLMAGYTVASLPLVVMFLFCMKLFVRGLSAGAIKG
ncbi:MAG: carbohydrate ABC transporter permease [Victivallales bacterium]|jgi:probable ABC transporter permease protein yurM